MKADEGDNEMCIQRWDRETFFKRNENWRDGCEKKKTMLCNDKDFSSGLQYAETYQVGLAAFP